MELCTEELFLSKGSSLILLLKFEEKSKISLSLCEILILIHYQKTERKTIFFDRIFFSLTTKKIIREKFQNFLNPDNQESSGVMFFYSQEIEKFRLS